jgi:hypothetical protein
MKYSLVAVGILCAATRANAQAADQIAIYGCQYATQHMIREPMLQGDSIRFSPELEVQRPSPHATVVRGNGEYQHRQGSRWHWFAFDCTFDARSGETSDVKVRFRPTTDERSATHRARRHPRRAP